MPKKKNLRILDYINDSGSGLVTAALMRAKNDDFEVISEHPAKECFDLRGHLEILPVYLIPRHVLEKILQLRLKGEMNFRHFRGLEGEIPKEVSENSFIPQVKKKTPAFKAATARLKQLTKKRSGVKKRRKASCA